MSALAVNNFDFNHSTILITGGTGSFGKAMTKTILSSCTPKKLIIFSRDELKQYEMAEALANHPKAPFIRFFLGNVRDPDRLFEAFDNVDVVVHTAALKQIPATEYNPFEAVQTNVLGAQNIIRAAIKQKVKKVMALSTDKASSPINLYGATKLCSDKLFIAGNAMSGEAKTLFSVVRYGNVFASRGSVIPKFLSVPQGRPLPVTDKRMTRFSITMDHAAEFVMSMVQIMQGGEIFIPKIPSFNIMELVKAILPSAEIQETGIRPGEKLHEQLISADDTRNAYEFEDFFVIKPEFFSWDKEKYTGVAYIKKCDDDFVYNSQSNSNRLHAGALRKLIAEYQNQNT